MKKIPTKDLALMALVITIIFVLGYLLTPIMGMAPIPAYKALVVSPLYGIGIGVILNRVNRVGVVTLVGLVFGLLLFPFSPFMLVAPVVSGIFTDLTCFVIFRNYDGISKKAIAGGLFPAIHIPVVMAMMGFALKGVYLEALYSPLLVLAPTVLCFTLAFVFSYYFLKIIDKRKH